LKISIVIPVLNGARFIRETIESILAQTYHNFEVIVYDAKSTDETLKIVNEYGLNCISEKDKGQSDAINKGFKQLNGDILAWQNADDIYLPDTLEIVADYFEKHAKADIMYGNYQEIDKDGNWLCNVYPRAWNTWLFSRGRFCPVQTCVFWRRKVWENAGPLDISLNYCMDVDFYSRAINQGFNFTHIPYTFGKFRIHEKSKTYNIVNKSEFKREYRSVLSRNFKYGIQDYLFFELFYYRSHLASFVKRNWLKK